MRIRINFWIEKELADKIDDFWHENRLMSRTEAIKKLLQIAFETVEARKKDHKK